MQFSIVKNKNTFLKNCCFCCNMKRSNLRKTLSLYISLSLSVYLSFQVEKTIINIDLAFHSDVIVVFVQVIRETRFAGEVD